MTDRDTTASPCSPQHRLTSTPRPTHPPVSSQWQGSIKLSLTESTPFPAGGKICTAFAGEDSCCDSTMLSAISLANDAVSASLVVSEKAWEAVDYSSMTSALNLVCLAAGIFSGKGDTCQVTFCDIV